MNKLVAGAIAGAAATIPMSWAMELMHRLLPHHERHPLPPREITHRVSEMVGVNDQLDEEQRVWLSLAAHLGYGAAVGTVYESLARKIKLPPIAKGTVYGLAVWTGSYLGVLPALGILSPATKHPVRRTAVMVGAHLVWGSALGAFTDLLVNGSSGDNLRFLGNQRRKRGHPREALHV
jgi:uncharacterized membrane protein YagU involved in acid resistance